MSMDVWTIEYDNEAGPDDEWFRNWWGVTDGITTFEARTEGDAQWLRDTLNKISEDIYAPDNDDNQINEVAIDGFERMFPHLRDTLNKINVSTSPQ